MVVKLYGQVTAACPQRVLLCFLEKGIEFEIIHIDLDTFEQKKPEHLLRQVKKTNFLNLKHKYIIIIVFMCSHLVKFQP